MDESFWYVAVVLAALGVLSGLVGVLIGAVGIIRSERIYAWESSWSYLLREVVVLFAAALLLKAFLDSRIDIFWTIALALLIPFPGVLYKFWKERGFIRPSDTEVGR